jgi:hypothetical protein
MRTSTIIASAIALALGALPSMAASIRGKREVDSSGDTLTCNLASHAFPCVDATAACQLIQDKLLGENGFDGNQEGTATQEILAETNTTLVVANGFGGAGTPTTSQAQQSCFNLVKLCCPTNTGTMTKASITVGSNAQMNIQIIELLDR